MSAEGIIGIILAALLGLTGVLYGLLFARINALENRVRKSENYNRRMWEWARRHVDLYYTYRRAGSPDPDPIPSEDDDE